MTPEDIVNIRRGLFLTQRLFAERLGVSLATVKSWELGQRQPSLAHLKRLTQEQADQRKNVHFTLRDKK